MSLETLLTSYGPAAVFAGCFLEGETVAVLGGFISHRSGASGLSGPWGMAGMAAAGAFAADQFWFLLGRHAPDRGWLARARTTARDSRLAALLHRHRLLAVFAFRYIPGTRIAGPLLLAQTPIGWPLYLATNLVSALLWAALFTALGYHFGLAVEGGLGRLAGRHWLLLALGLGAAGLVLHRLLRRRFR